MARLTDLFRLDESRVYRVFLVVDITDSTGMKASESEASWLTTYGWFYDLLEAVLEGNESGGTITKFVGDGAMAVFGEDNANDAIKAAIALQEKLQDERQSKLVKLNASVGISSGTARMFQLSNGATDFLGSTVDRAFRLCSAANTNAVFVDDATVAAAAMNRLSSTVGQALRRSVAEYQGDAQEILLKGFERKATYYEIWWAEDRFGVNPEHVTKETQKREQADRSAPPVKQRPQQEPDHRGEWKSGTVTRFSGTFGFIKSEGVDHYVNPGYLFNSAFSIGPGDHAMFLPLPPHGEGQSPRASTVFVYGQSIRGTLLSVNADKGYGFAEVRGSGSGATHSLFLDLAADTVFKKGDEIECTLSGNRQGPIGINVTQVGAA